LQPNIISPLKFERAILQFFSPQIQIPITAKPFFLPSFTYKVKRSERIENEYHDTSPIINKTPGWFKKNEVFAGKMKFWLRKHE
jgi:hypothetical protein